MAAIAMVAASGTPARASAVRECGDVSAGLDDPSARLVNVTSRNVPCGHARSFAIRWERRAGLETGFVCDEDRRCTWRGWRCRNVQSGHYVLDHRCVQGARVVRWQVVF